MGNRGSKRNSQLQECQDASAKGCQSLVHVPVGPVQETASSDGYGTETVYGSQFESSVMETPGSCMQEDTSVELGELVVSPSTPVRSQIECTPVPVSDISSHEHSQSVIVTGALQYTITPCSRWERNTNITHTTGVSTSPDTGSMCSSYLDEIALINNKESNGQSTQQQNHKSVTYEQWQILESEKQRLLFLKKTERLSLFIKRESNFESNENITIQKMSHKTDYNVASQKVSQEVDGGTMAGGQTTSGHKKKIRRKRRSQKSRAILPCTLQQGAFTSGSGQHGRHRQRNTRPRRHTAGKRKKASHKQESLTRGELMVHVSESSQSSSSSSNESSDGEPTHNLTKQLKVSVPSAPSSGHTGTRKGAQEDGILLKTTTSNLKSTPLLTGAREPQGFSSPLESHMPGDANDSNQKDVDDHESQVRLKPDTELQQEECVSSKQATQSVPTTDGSELLAEPLSQVESTDTVLISSEDSSFETTQQIFPVALQQEITGDPDENPGHSHPLPDETQGLLSNDPKRFMELYGPDPGGGPVHTPPINSPPSLGLPVTPSEINYTHLVKIGSGGGEKLESWLRGPASPKEVNNLCIGMVQFKRALTNLFGFKNNAIWRIGIDNDGKAHIPDDTLEANVPVALFLSTLIGIVAFYLKLPRIQEDHLLKHDINSHKLSVFVKACGGSADSLDYALLQLGAIKSITHCL